MQVINHSCLDPFDAAGCRSVKVVERGFGVQSFGLWSVKIEPGAVLPPGSVACNALPPTAVTTEQVIVVHSGKGMLTIDEVSCEVRAPCRLMIPVGSRWKVRNSTEETLYLVVAQFEPTRD
jgi:mannose-6-phosphate isomerase-like protein (cupin superfamily)